VAEDNGLALVTGASSGIGLELARCFARDGHALVITADDRNELESAAHELGAEGAPRVATVVADLAERDGAARLYEAVRGEHGTPDFLVNNAGRGVYGDFARETELAAELRMIQLNVVSVVELTKRFVPDMIARGRGKILITSSIAALAPTPRLGVYSATKAFDFAFAEALANELKDTGVTVTALLPSETETEFFRRAGMEDSPIGQSSKADPADIARAGYSAMMKGTDHVIAPFTAKMRAALTSVLPASMVTAMARPE
jgi:short-subunit dehydrogenase